MKNHTENAIKFVQVWEAATSTREVSRRLSMPLGTVRYRAWCYRRKGVPLKNFDTARLDWAQVIRACKKAKKK
jgi:hypothetical protein